MAKDKEPFLHLDLSHWEKEVGRETYRVIAEVWLSRWSGNSPRVQITVDGALWQGQEFYILDKQCCLTAHITGLTLGSHSIVVVTADGRHRNVKSINIPAPEKKKKKKPVKILIHRSGHWGDYHLILQVLAEDKSPVSKAAIRIVDPQAAHPDRIVRADKDGLYKLILKFDEPERIITLILPGSTYSDEIRLLGPKEKHGW